MSDAVWPECSIVVGTFGDTAWVDLAQSRAVPSAEAAGAGQVIHRHGETLAQGRNEGVRIATGEWIVHLDADDELEPGYLEAMREASADLRAPAVRYLRADTGRPASTPGLPRVAGHEHACVAACLEAGNWLVIGTAVRRQAVLDVGGWVDWPVYEDWALWRRLWRAGATVESVPAAIYRAHARSDSRNRGMPIEERNRVHYDIVAATP